MVETKEEAVHAGYELDFTDEDFKHVREAVSKILEKNMDSAAVEKIGQKRYNARCLQQETQTIYEYVAQNLIDSTRPQIRSAQIHISNTVTAKEVYQWYTKASKRGGDKYAYIKKMFVSFQNGIVAFVACINSQQVYVTMTNNGNITLQGVKRLFNHAEKSQPEYVCNLELQVAIRTYIFTQKKRKPNFYSCP